MHYPTTQQLWLEVIIYSEKVLPMCTRRHTQNVHITTAHEKKKKFNNLFIHQKYKGKMVEYLYKIMQYNNETSMTYNHT